MVVFDSFWEGANMESIEKAPDTYILGLARVHARRSIVASVIEAPNWGHNPYRWSDTPGKIPTM